MDAISVGSGGALGFYNITVRNMGARGSRGSHTVLEPDFFGFWPSVTVSPGAQASFHAPMRRCSCCSSHTRMHAGGMSGNDAACNPSSCLPACTAGLRMQLPD